jgi:hypothetical protein
MEDLKYPIGQYTVPEFFTKEILDGYISSIALFPKTLKLEVEHLTESQLNVAYRPGGWSLTQVVNHCADSHMNALIRIKLALTEETPIIKPYRQELWAELEDAKLPVRFALQSIEGIHARWVALFESLTPEQWNRAYIHPEKGREVSLKECAGSYAWHGEHHLAHIKGLKDRMGWS